MNTYSRDHPWFLDSTSSSSATINHYHHHHLDRHHRAAATWTRFARHPRAEEIPNTERDLLILPGRKLLCRLLLRTVPIPCVRLISSSSSPPFSTHPAICVAHLSRILNACVDCDCSFDSVEHFVTEPRALDILYYPGTEITRSSLSRILYTPIKPKRLYIKYPTDNIRLLQ